MLMLVLMLLFSPLAARLYSPKKDLAPCWFRSCSAPKIKSLGRLTTFSSAVVVAQHVRNLSPGCVLRDIDLWVFFSFFLPRGTVTPVSETVTDMPLCLTHRPACLPVCCILCRTGRGWHRGLAPWAVTVGWCRLYRTAAFCTLPQVLNRNPLVPRLSFLLRHVDDMSSHVSAKHLPRALLPRSTEATAPGGRSLLRQGTHAMSPCGGSYLRCFASDALSQVGAGSAVMEGCRG